MGWRKITEFEGVEYTVNEMMAEYAKRHPDLKPMSKHTAYHRIENLPNDGDLFTPIIRKNNKTGGSNKNDFPTGKQASVKRLEDTKNLFGLLTKVGI